VDRIHGEGIFGMSNQHIKGGRELDQLLQTIPVKLEKNIMRSALGMGARVIMREAKSLAPVGAPSNTNAKKYGGYAGALKDSVRVKSGFTKKGEAYASVKAGGRTKRGADVFYAHIVEFGARSHMIKPNKKKHMEIGGKFVAGEVSHPGIRAQPFMRPAVDAKANDAVRAVENQVRKRIQKEGLDVPAPSEDTL
jgi:HK97 gp10 family phage protein